MGIRRLLMVCVALNISLCSLSGSGVTEFIRFEPGANGLIGDYFFTVTEDSIGNIWIGGQTGLFRFDGYEFVNYTAQLSHTNVRNIAVDEDGMLWACTSNGLNLIDPGTDNIKVFYSDPEDAGTISDNNPEPLIDDGTGAIWVGTFHGLNKWHRESGQFTRYYAMPENGPMWENRYYTILQDRFQDSILWLGSASGLQRFNKSSGEFTFIHIPLVQGMSGKEPRVFGLHQHEDGRLWIGLNAHNMLLSYDPDEKRWESFEAGLTRQLTPNRIAGTYHILKKSSSTLWVSMVCGIGEFDMSSGSFNWFNLGNTEQGSAYASAARRLFADSKGHLWIPSLTGISRSHERLLRVPSRRQSVFPVRMFIDGVDMKRPYDSAFNTVTLEFHQNTIEVDFRLLNPTRPNRVEYGHRLLGYSNNWSSADSGIVHFADLAKGNYVLEMRAREEGAPWSEIVSIPIVVHTAWWRSAWFLGSIAVFLLLIGAVIFAIRLIHRKREAQMRADYQRELVQVRMEALRAQMNPHFLFNTMNSINHYILKNDRRSASGYLTKFSRLIRLVLNHSKADLVPLSAELEALKLYIQLEQLRFERQFEFTIQIGEQISTDDVYVPPLLIQPYVENAIWHGLMQKEGAGRLEIRISKHHDHLMVRVKDDGIGRKAAKAFQASLGKSQSLGTSLTSNRIHLVNRLHGSTTEVKINDLYHENNEAAGTEVVITIPLIEHSQIHPA